MPIVLPARTATIQWQLRGIERLTGYYSNSPEVDEMNSPETAPKTADLKSLIDTINATPAARSIPFPRRCQH